MSRFSNDQFCILLKNRPYSELVQTFNEIKEVISSTPINCGDGEKLFIKVSVGANINLSESLDEMIYLADEALCNVKHKKLDKVLINS